MSGFSADWLALREPADHRARSRDLLAALAEAFAGRDEITVVDLGCGTGSNLRACAPWLPRRQHWRLVDYDPALLAAARGRLSGWADHCAMAGGELHLTRADRTIAVSFVSVDLAADLDAALGSAPDLVTAAALFDLASAAWIERFVDAVVHRRAAFYTALTYNGVESWSPPHPADEAVTRAFHAHQRRDKGFGLSAGPQASDALVQAFTASGYEVRTAESPWRLGSTDDRLIEELAKGVAEAARETGRVEENDLIAWLDARRTGAACVIGHTDLLALPSR
jgi:SAM-dependent methyltransferase